MAQYRSSRLIAKDEDIAEVLVERGRLSEARGRRKEDNKNIDGEKIDIAQEL